MPSKSLSKSLDRYAYTGLPRALMPINSAPTGGSPCSQEGKPEDLLSSPDTSMQALCSARVQNEQRSGRETAMKLEAAPCFHDLFVNESAAVVSTGFFQILSPGP